MRITAKDQSNKTQGKGKKIHCNLMKQSLIKRKHKLCLETQLLIIFYENTHLKPGNIR